MPEKTKKTEETEGASGKKEINIPKCSGTVDNDNRDHIRTSYISGRFVSNSDSILEENAYMGYDRRYSNITSI